MLLPIVYPERILPGKNGLTGMKEKKCVFSRDSYSANKNNCIVVTRFAFY